MAAVSVKRSIVIIIIHNFFSISDWLKSNSLFFITSVDQLWKTFAICKVSIVQRVIVWKRDGIREALGTSLCCFGRKIKNSGTVDMFRRKIAELLPENIAKTARIQLGGWHLPFEQYLLELTSLYILNLARNRQIKSRTLQHLLVCL